MARIRIEISEIPCPRCGGELKKQFGSYWCNNCQDTDLHTQYPDSVESYPLHLNIWEGHLEKAYWIRFSEGEVPPPDLAGKDKATAPMLPTGQPHLRWQGGKWGMSEY